MPTRLGAGDGVEPSVVDQPDQPASADRSACTFITRRRVTATTAERHFGKHGVRLQNGLRRTGPDCPTYRGPWQPASTSSTQGTEPHVVRAYAAWLTAPRPPSTLASPGSIRLISSSTTCGTQLWSVSRIGTAPCEAAPAARPSANWALRWPETPPHPRLETCYPEPIVRSR